MSSATLRFTLGRLEWSRRPNASVDYVPVTPDDLQRFGDWTARYDTAIAGIGSREKALLAIGDEIGGWLNRLPGFSQFLDEPGRLHGLEFAVDAHPDADATAFLQTPWELARRGNAWLAADPYRFAPVRRLGTAGTRLKLGTHRLSMLFMAAAPRDQHVLEFELEETVILNAVSGIGIDLVVEETGSAKGLGDTATRWLPAGVEAAEPGDAFDVVHLTCHGTAEPAPALALEDDFGTTALTGPGPLLGNLRHLPRLLVVSACETGKGFELSSAFAQQVVSLGVPAALGWSGRVQDGQAILFAEALYRELSQRASLESAVAVARAELLQGGLQGEASRDWHLARLYLGPTGGGVLCGGTTRRLPNLGDLHQRYLDGRNNRVPVAGPHDFVGRRRELQALLRQLRGSSAGVLIHGVGRQGKSSLAARLAVRCPGHAVVVLDRLFSAGELARALEEAVPAITKWQSDWSAEIEQNPGRLQVSLSEALRGPLANAQEDSGRRNQPVLLVLDDFEQCLEADPADHEHGWRLRHEMEAVIAAVLRAFMAASNTESRLLLTCRYTFSLPNGVLPRALFPFSLPGLTDAETRKQAHTPAIREGAAPPPAHESEAARQARVRERDELIEAVHREARGNAGFQAILLKSAHAEPAACRASLDALAAHRESGRPLPEGEHALQKFLADLALGSLIDQLSPNETELLRVSQLFEHPVPAAVFEAVSREFSLGTPAPGTRLFGLGLWERAEEPVPPYTRSPLLNGLTRGTLESKGRNLTPGECVTLAAIAAPALFQEWGRERRWAVSPTAAMELLRLGLLGEAVEVVAETASRALHSHRDKLHAQLGYERATAAVELLDRNGREPGTNLLSVAGILANTAGDGEAADTYLSRASAGTGMDPVTRAYTWFEAGVRHRQAGRLEEAEQNFRAARKLRLELGQEQQVAVCDGAIADIL